MCHVHAHIFIKWSSCTPASQNKNVWEANTLLVWSDSYPQCCLVQKFLPEILFKHLKIHFLFCHLYGFAYSMALLTSICNRKIKVFKHHLTSVTCASFVTGSWKLYIFNLHHFRRGSLSHRNNIWTVSYLYHFVTGRLKRCLKFECFFCLFFVLLQELWVLKHYLQLIIFHHFVTGSLEWPRPAEWVCCCYGCHFCLVVCIHCKKSSSTIGSNCSIKLFLFFNT